MSKHLKRAIALLAALAIAVSAFAQDKPDALKSYRVGRELEQRGDATGAAKRYTEAVAICLEEIKAMPRNLDSYTVLCWTLLRQEKYQDVIDWGLRGLAVSEDFRIVEVMGEAYFFLGKLEESLKYLRKYTVALPEGDRTATAFFYMAECYMRLKKFSHADIAYTTAVKLEPSMARWWFRLGNARELAGEPRSAILAYDRALALSPDYKEARAAKEKLQAGLSGGSPAAAAPTTAAPSAAPSATPALPSGAAGSPAPATP